MPDIFVYGTLRHVPLLRLIADQSVTPRAAVLPEMAIRCAASADYPVPVPDDTAMAQGVICRVDDDGFARLNWYESAFGYAPVTHTVRVDGTDCEALVWLPQTTEDAAQEPWNLSDWQAKWADLTLRAAQEAMALFGKVPASQVGRFWETFQGRADAAIRAANMARPVVGSDTHADTVEQIEQGHAHAGFFVTRADRLRHPTFAGGTGPVLDRETFLTGDASVVLPYDPVRDRVLLTEQFRMGPYARGAAYPWTLEPVAGRVDPGETPETCAMRECVEEAGVALRELIPAAHHYPSTGATSEFLYTYIGLCDLPDLPAGGGGLADEGEDIRTHLLSFDAAMDLVSSGEATDGPLVLLLLWLERVRPRLRATA